MMNWQGKRYWLIGASEGLGAALARKLNAAGVEVIVSARNEDKLKALVDQMPGKASYVTLDVSDRTSIEEAAEKVGQIDGMIYLAGVYWPMKSQEWNAEQAEAMADVNFTGAIRSVGAVLPAMVARDSGHIMITGSLSAFRGLPGAIGYAASKAGTLVLAESLYADLRKTGVRVQVANPGFVKTRLTDKNDFKMPYLMEPDDAAQEMFELMNDEDCFMRSFPRPFSWLFRVSQLMPDWLYYRVFS